jgi:hypothetical protein
MSFKKIYSFALLLPLLCAAMEESLPTRMQLHQQAQQALINNDLTTVEYIIATFEQQGHIQEAQALQREYRAKQAQQALKKARENIARMQQKKQALALQHTVQEALDQIHQEQRALDISPEHQQILKQQIARLTTFFEQFIQALEKRIAASELKVKQALEQRTRIAQTLTALEQKIAQLQHENAQLKQQAALPLVQSVPSASSPTHSTSVTKPRIVITKISPEESFARLERELSTKPETVEASTPVTLQASEYITTESQLAPTSTSTTEAADLLLTMSQQLAQKNQANTQAQARIQELQAQLHTANQKIQELTNAEQERQALMKQHTHDTAHAQARIQTLESELERAARKIKSLEEDLVQAERVFATFAAAQEKPSSKSSSPTTSALPLIPITEKSMPRPPTGRIEKE